MIVHCVPIDKPLRFTDANEVYEVLLAITEGWSFAKVSEDGGAAFIGVSRCKGGFVIEEEGREAFCEDSTVSAACSLIVILLNRMIANDPDRLCLHAGAVAVDGQTLVFPSTHRAGKSTLVTALAFKGWKLVADDILPLDCTGGKVKAVASGVAPRLRIPLAASLGLRFRFSAWRSTGADDGYYRYIRLPPPSRCPFGERHDLGVFVFLERGTGNVEARLHAVNRASAMRILLLQNFGIAAPSKVILDHIGGLAEDVPAFLLRYDDLASAVALLRRFFGRNALARELWSRLDRAEPDLGRMGCLETEQADFQPQRDRTIRHSDGVVLREAEGSLFLANPEQGGIFALDPLGAAIWKMMAEPASNQEIAKMIGEAYPDIEPARIAADVDRLIEALLARQLVIQVD